MYGLDIETTPKEKFKKEGASALEPYRVFSDEAEISALSVWGPSGLEVCIHYKMPNFRELIEKAIQNLCGQEVYCTNTVFDTSFLIATIGMESMRRVKWRDTAILNKWLVNGQKADALNVSYSLAESAKRYLKDWDKLEEFLDVKKQKVQAGDNFEYWLERNILDSEATYLIASKLEEHLHKMDNYRGYIITCNTILPIAEGYVTGIPIDVDEVNKYEKYLINKQQEILKEINKPSNSYTVSSSTLTSPKQLSELLYNIWGLQSPVTTPKGSPSTSHESLLMLREKHFKDRPEISLIMEYKTCATYLSKYVKGFRESISYLGKPCIHGQPRILSTITGRMTYSTKFFKKFQTSIALHQLPRKDKNTKRCMKAPKGYKVLYMDFSAQEGRVMAIRAPEPRMIESYNKGIDLHSDLTEEIFGTPYKDIVKANREGEPSSIVEQRQAGKLTGLSSFYRIGAKSLAGKFFSTYEYTIDIRTAQSYLIAFKRKYPGVVEYWNKAINFAKSKGYAEAFGGWRYRLESFDWKGESSSINHPIQGGGSMLTYAAIAVISKNWPQAIMVSQVHDSIAYFIPEDNSKALASEILTFMNNYDYGKLLGFNQTVPLIFDGGIGDNFADLEAIKL